MKDIYQHGPATISVRDYGDGDAEVVNVRTAGVRDRGKGHMRKCMEELLADADREGVVLLVVSGLGRNDGTGMTREQLLEWYERRGFCSLGPHRQVNGVWTTRMQRVPHVREEA